MAPSLSISSASSAICNTCALPPPARLVYAPRRFAEAVQSPPRRDLSHNRFRGPFPDDALRGKTKLSLLYLNDNELWSQRFPSALLAMTNLAALNVGGNQLEGTIPLALNRLSYLTKLCAPPTVPARA